MTRTVCCVLLSVCLAACTDLGVIGERASAKQSVAGAPETKSAAGAAGSSGAASSQQQCPFGVCDFPPLCKMPNLGCVLCDSNTDCTSDPAEHFCSPLTATCVSCLSAADCTPQAPYCDGGDCVACEDDDNCPDNRKCNDGHCERD